jgi:hypothetical protein
MAFGLRVCREEEEMIFEKKAFYFRIIFVINGMHLILLQYLAVLPMC